MDQRVQELLNRFSRGVLTLLLLIPLLLACEAEPAGAAWICDGDRLTAEVVHLGRDAIGTTTEPIPNISDGSSPGDLILLTWRGVTLQLPRTNNAGVPSYTDGRWWWQVEDPDHPDFRQRRSSIIQYTCDAETS